MWHAAERLLGRLARQQEECREQGATAGIGETVTVRIGERRATLQHVGEELNSVCPPECAAAAAELFAGPKHRCGNTTRDRSKGIE